MNTKPSPVRDTTGLRAHARQKADAAFARVEACLQQLQSEGKSVNFHAVAMAAGVTKSYLYAHPHWRSRITLLRQQHTPRLPTRSGASSASTRTEQSEAILLEAKNRRIQELEAEVKGLKEQVKRLYGKLYEQA